MRKPEFHIEIDGKWNFHQSKMKNWKIFKEMVEKCEKHKNFSCENRKIFFILQLTQEK